MLFFWFILRFIWKHGQVSSNVQFLVYLPFFSLYDSIKDWTFECLYDWVVYLKLAIPGLSLLLIEWSTFEIAIFLASINLETINLMSMAIQIFTLFYQLF